MRVGDSIVAKLSEVFIRYAVLALAFLMPIFVIPASWSNISQGKTLILALILVFALIAWLVSNVDSRRLVFSLDPILIVSLLIPAVYLLSALLAGTHGSMVSGEALQGTFASVAMLFGVALIAAIYARGDRRASVTLLLVLLASAAVVFLFQTIRIVLPSVLSLNDLMQGSTSSIVGAWHDFGIFAGLSLLICCGLLETSLATERIKGPALRVLAAASFLMLFVVNFSDTWVILSFACLVFALFRGIRSYRRQRNVLAAARFAILWIGLAVIAMIIAFTNSFIFPHLPQALQLTQVEVRPSWQGTFSVGQQVLGEGKAFVFGSGPNSFDEQWARFKPTEVNATNFWNVDFQSGIGVVPTALVTVGILGTLSWVLLILALFWGGYRTLVEEPDNRLRALLFIASGFLMAFHVIYVPGISISVLLFILLGMLAGLNLRAWRIGVLSPAPQSVAVFAATLVVVCGVIGSSLIESRAVVSTLYTYRAADIYSKTGDLSRSASLVSRAVALDPRNDIAQRAAIEMGLLQLSKLASTGASDPASKAALQTMLSQTISHGLTAVSIDDKNYQNWLALAGLYKSLAGVGIQGAYEQAFAAYLRAASTTPTNPAPLIQLAQIAISQNKANDALPYLAQAISLKPNLALPYYLRSQIEASQGQYQAAAQDAVIAAQIANQDPMSWYNLGVILYAANDLQNAAVSFERAIALQNQYSDALFALAVVYDKLGMRDNAIANIQKVQSLNPNDATVAKVAQNITEGKPALGGVGGQPEQGALQAK